MKWHLRDYIVMAMAMGLGALIVETLGWTPPPCIRCMGRSMDRKEVEWRLA